MTHPRHLTDAAHPPPDADARRARRARLLDALSGMLVLAVAMGFGRFAFTGLYPLMVKEGVVSVASGSFAASANYAGYLAGALLATRFNHSHAARMGMIAAAGTVICTALLALPLGTALFVAARFVAGVMSAVAIIGASVWLLQVIGYHKGAPVLFAGVGLGILISAEVIAAGHAFGLSSMALWGWLGAFTLVFTALAWPRLRASHRSGVSAATAASSPASASTSASAASAHAAHAKRRSQMGAWTLVFVYGLAGFGYIVTATYLPLLVRQVLPGADPIQIWAAFGLGAAPSCFLWHALLQRYGTRVSMALNLLVQAIGVILPVFGGGAAVFLASALLVGGTFVGTVTIAMPAARETGHTVRYNLTAVMTSAYGVGQILGPVVSGHLFALTHSFNQPLMVACAALLVGMAACFR